MILVWNRKGFLVPLIWLAGAFLLSSLLPEAIPQPIGAPLLLIACALVYWPLGRWLNRDLAALPGRSRHSFFFLPMEFWAWPALAFAVYLVLKNSQNS